MDVLGVCRRKSREIRVLRVLRCAACRTTSGCAPYHISGFTSLSERLEPEQVAEIIDPVLAALGDVVAGYDGFINKYAGDALLALFGAPVAHEDDATSASPAAPDSSLSPRRQD